jgi:hypothetical protein
VLNIHVLFIGFIFLGVEFLFLDMLEDFLGLELLFLDVIEDFLRLIVNLTLFLPELFDLLFFFITGSQLPVLGFLCCPLGHLFF